MPRWYARLAAQDEVFVIGLFVFRIDWPSFPVDREEGGGIILCCVLHLADVAYAVLEGPPAHAGVKEAKVNIEYLREFIEIGLTLNLSKAARTLHISQPSLSKHIAALEKEAQTPLLSRSASRIQLTPAGQALFEEAYDLVRRHDQMVARIRSYKEVCQLRVGGLYDSGRIIGMMNRALAKVNAEQTRVSLSYQNYRHKSLGELLGEDRIDLAILMLSRSDERRPDYEQVFLGKDPMVCLVDASHPLYTRDKLSIADLDGQTIWQPVGSHSAEYGRSTVSDILSHHQVQPIEKPVFVHSITELTTIPHEGGMFIMERSMLDTQPYADNFKILEFIEEDVAFSFYALWRKDHSSTALRQFVEALAEVAQETEG